MRTAIFAVFLLGFVALADTLVLVDGTALEGRLVGVSPTVLLFSGASGVAQIPLEKVSRVTLDLASDPKPRVARADWSRALGQAQRELWNCRNLRQGTVLAGLLFIGFGQWLNTLGYAPAGHLLSLLGALGVLWGLSVPQPGCEIPAARLRTLLYIGLEHGWLY